MPYEWVEDAAKDPPGTGAQLHARPYRSLPRRGFVWFLGATAVLISLPLFSVLGSVAFWGLLPFLLGSVAFIWWALERSYRDGAILEELHIGAEDIQLTRHNPRGPDQNWSSQTYWTRVALHATGGPVPNYVTLSGSGREVEIGAFLSEDERLALYDDLLTRLAEARDPRT